MSFASRCFGGIAVVALLFAVGCSSSPADSPEKPAAAPEAPAAVDKEMDVTDPDQIALEVTGYMSAGDVLTSLEIERPDGSHINLVPADDVSYYLDGVSITPAEALVVYTDREGLIYVALDTWVLDDPMDVSEGDVYTVANFTAVTPF